MVSMSIKAVEFIQTDRTGWCMALSVKEIIGMLKPREQPKLIEFTETNRPMSEAHLRGIAEFLEGTPHWAIPSIVLAAYPGAIGHADDGLVKIDTELVGADKVRILDGQHRVQALFDVFHKLEREGDATKVDDFVASEIPVVIFEVKDIDDQRQLFAWFARNKPIEPAVREWFDPSDPFTSVGRYAMLNCPLLKNRVNFGKGRTTVNDKNLLTLIDLKRIAIAIALGVGQKVVSKQVRELYGQEEKQDELRNNMALFFDDFLPACREEYAVLADEDEVDFSFKRIDTYAFEPPVLRLLADGWARWAIDQNEPQDKLAEYVQSLNLSRGNPLNDLINNFEVVNQGNKRCKGVTDKAWEQATKSMLGAVTQG